MLMTAILAFGQEVKSIDNNGVINYTKIVKVEGNKNEVYQKVLQYIGQYFTSANRQIEYKDENSGRIIAKQTDLLNFYGKPSKIYYNVFFDVKDDKVRIQVKDISFENNLKTFPIENYPKSWTGKNKFYDKIDATSLDILNDFETKINNLSTNEDW